MNGDFFDINNSTAPLGVGIKDGELVQSPDGDPTWRKSAAILTADGLGRIGEVLFEGTIALPGGGTAPLAGVNKPTLAADGIEAFTPLWGTYCRCRATQGATATAEVEVVDGKVTAVRATPAEGAIPAGGFVLVGREAGAGVLAGLAVGDAVSIDYRARTADDQEIRTALNGRQLLVVNGVAQKASQGNNVPPAPRTAVGFSQDGSKMFVLTADGRQPAFADGLGLDELAAMMIELGAYNAVNLDGGGSTTMVDPYAGEHDGGGREPPVRRCRTAATPTGWRCSRRRGPESCADSGWRPRWTPIARPGSSTVAPARPDRVFPGLTRTPHRGRLRRDVRPGAERPVLAYERTAPRHRRRQRRLPRPLVRRRDGHRQRRLGPRHDTASPCSVALARLSGTTAAGGTGGSGRARRRSGSWATTPTATWRRSNPPTSRCRTTTTCSTSRPPATASSP